MPLAFASILEAAILASSLSIDAFTAGFAYGSKKIRIPLLSVQIINLICSFITGISLFAGAILKPYLPDWLILTFAFSILFVIGVIKLLDSITKSIIYKNKSLNKIKTFSLFHFLITFHVRPNPESINENPNANVVISSIEAAALAISLSLDGIAVGFGAALINVNALAVFLCSFATNSIAIMLGCHIGNHIARKVTFNLSWLSGLVLIGLAFSKFL